MMYVLNIEISNKFILNIKYCLCTQLHTTPLFGGMIIFYLNEMQDHKYSAVPYFVGLPLYNQSQVYGDYMGAFHTNSQHPVEAVWHCFYNIIVYLEDDYLI